MPHVLNPLRAVSGVALFAALGMVLGYARDAALAGMFGAAAVTDAFFVATLVPMLAATVVMSGALAPALLPVFTGALDRRPQAFALANAVLTCAGLALIGLTLILIITAPYIVRTLAPGLDESSATLAVELLILTSPLLVLIGVSALLGALANALGSFRVPALSPVLVNGGALALIVIAGATWGIRAAAWGLVLGALAQLLVQWFALFRQGWRYFPALDISNPAVRKVFRLFVPLALFVGLAQVVPVVERVVGSRFPEGGLSQLVYAGKLYQIPGMVLSASLALVLFPRLAHLQREPHHAAFDAELRAGLRLALFLTLPLAFWFLWNARPLVQLTFERGAFSAADTGATARLLQVYSLGTAPAALVLLLTRAYHARQAMWLPLGVGGLTLVVYVAAALALSSRIGLEGLPAAFVISQLFAGTLLGALTFGWNRMRSAFVSGHVLRLLGASLVMPACLTLWTLGAGAIADHSAGGVLLELGLSLVIGGLLYLAVASRLNVPEARLVLELLHARQVLTGAYRQLLRVAGGRGWSRVFPFNLLNTWLTTQILPRLKTPVATVHGHRMRLDPLDSLGLSTYGTWEPFETRVLSGLVQPGDVVVDVGANIGYYTLLFARWVGPTGQVIAFEPAPANVALLRDNIARNGYGNVVVEPSAVSDRRGEADLYLSRENLGDHRLGVEDHRLRSAGGQVTVRVPLVRLDDYFREARQLPALVKIDVQGAEQQVLDGMQDLLSRAGALTLVLEFSPAALEQMGTAPPALLEFLRGQGLQIYELDEKARCQRPVDGGWYDRARFGADGLTNLLCCKRTPSGA